MSKTKAGLDSEDSDDDNLDEDFKQLANKKQSSASASSSDSDEWSAKGRMKRKKKMTSPPSKRSRALDAEEGEVTDSESEDEFDDGLDDQLIRDEEDRRRLEDMSEKEREQELYNRIEKREALKTRFEIEKKMRETRRKNGRGPSDNRVTARRKTMDTSRRQSRKGSALDSLKASREEKKKIEKTHKQDEEQKKKNLSSIYSDDDDDDPKPPPQLLPAPLKSSSSSSSSSASEDEEDEEGMSVEDGRKKGEEVSNRQQLNQVRLSRHKLEKWCHYPMFEQVVVDCYVKIGIGRHNGKQVYRVARIVGVVETSKVYELESTSTNKGLRLKYGNSEQMYRLKFVSNQEFSEGEFERWRLVMGEASCALPNLLELDKKLKVIRDTIDHKFTNDEVTQMIAERKRFQKVPNNYALEKTELRRQIDCARESGDRDKETDLSKQIDSLEEQAAESYKKRTSNISSIGFINERNRKKNMEGMVEACKREVAEMQNAKPDPFTRRRCRPTLVTKSRETDNQTSTQTSQQTTQDTETCTETDKQKNKRQHNDLFSVHDFDISIDLGIDADVPRSLGPPPPSSSHDHHDQDLMLGRRHLNLDEYKKKRGLI